MNLPMCTFLSIYINFNLLTFSIDNPKASIVWFYNTDTTDLMSKLLDIRATHTPATIWSPSSLFAILINSDRESVSRLSFTKLF